MFTACVSVLLPSHCQCLFERAGLFDRGFDNLEHLPHSEWSLSEFVGNCRCRACWVVRWAWKVNSMAWQGCSQKIQTFEDSFRIVSDRFG